MGALLLGCSSGNPGVTSPRDPALDRLRERVTERRAANDSRASENEADEELVASEDSEGASTPIDDEPALLEPRFRGALPDSDPRVLGVFDLRTNRDPIVDGDTVAVLGLDASLRLVCLDAEEVWHGHDDLRERAYSDFDDYLRLIYEGADGIPKFATPMGETARDFARAFFAGDTQVRLEYDDVTNTRGYFNRYLVYVYALRDGEWVNYNLEAVRAGMSPYFTKYGYSARFHQEFLDAQAEARAEQRGIWDPVLPHYRDYDERFVWWNRRAEAVAHFRATYGNREDYFAITNDDEYARIRSFRGQTVTIFATISDIHYDWSPTRVVLSHRAGDDFMVVSFDESTLRALNFERFLGEYLYVRGRLNLYREDPQFIAGDGVEIWTEP